VANERLAQISAYYGEGKLSEDREKSYREMFLDPERKEEAARTMELLDGFKGHVAAFSSASTQGQGKGKSQSDSQARNPAEEGSLQHIYHKLGINGKGGSSSAPSSVKRPREEQRPSVGFANIPGIQGGGPEALEVRANKKMKTEHGAASTNNHGNGNAEPGEESAMERFVRNTLNGNLSLTATNVPSFIGNVRSRRPSLMM